MYFTAACENKFVKLEAKSFQLFLLWDIFHFQKMLFK